MKIVKTLYRQNASQKERGTATYKLTISGKPSDNSCYEKLIFEAYQLGYLILENGAYVGIDYEDIHIIRVKKYKDDTLRIRYFEKIFKNNPLINNARPSGGKLANKINLDSSLSNVINMLKSKMGNK